MKERSGSCCGRRGTSYAAVALGRLVGIKAVQQEGYPVADYAATYAGRRHQWPCRSCRRRWTSARYFGAREVAAGYGKRPLRRLASITDAPRLTSAKSNIAKGKVEDVSAPLSAWAADAERLQHELCNTLLKR